MRGRSLRLRLGLAASALITLALALAGLGLVVLFDRVLQIRAAEDLDRTAKFLAGQVVLTPDGMPSLTVDPPDPRFGDALWRALLADRRRWRRGASLALVMG